MNRREFLASTAGAGATVAVGSKVAPRYSPIGRAEASPVLVGAAAVATGVGLYYLYERYKGQKKDGHISKAEFEETNAEESWIESYDKTSLLKDQMQMSISTWRNRVEDCEHIAMNKGKARAISHQRQGHTRSDAKAGAKEAVDEYLGDIQQNIVDYHEQIIVELGDIYAHAETWATDHPDATAPTDVIHGKHSSALPYGNSPSALTAIHPDKSTHDTSGYRDYHSTDNEEHVYTIDPSYTSGDTVYGAPMKHQPPPSSSLSVLNFGDGGWQDVMQKLFDIQTRVHDNIDAVTDAIYEDWQAGELDERDYLDPSTLAQEYSSDYDTTGHYAYAAAQLGILGHAGKIPTAVTIEIEESGEQHEGTMFWRVPIPNQSITVASYSDEYELDSSTISGLEVTTSDEATTYVRGTDYTLSEKDTANGGTAWFLSAISGGGITEGSDVLVHSTQPRDWEVGKWHDPAVYTEPIFFVNHNTDDGIYELEGRFKIIEARDTETGKSLDVVKGEHSNYQTVTSERVDAEMQALRDLRDAVFDITSDDGAAGGTTDDGVSTTLLVGIAAIIAAGLLGRDSNQGGRRGGY